MADEQQGPQGSFYIPGQGMQVPHEVKLSLDPTQSIFAIQQIAHEGQQAQQALQSSATAMLSSMRSLASEPFSMSRMLAQDAYRQSVAIAPGGGMYGPSLAMPGGGAIINPFRNAAPMGGNYQFPADYPSLPPDIPIPGSPSRSNLLVNQAYNQQMAAGFWQGRVGGTGGAMNQRGLMDMANPFAYLDDRQGSLVDAGSKALWRGMFGTYSQPNLDRAVYEDVHETADTLGMNVMRHAGGFGIGTAGSVVGSIIGGFGGPWGGVVGGVVGGMAGSLAQKGAESLAGPYSQAARSMRYATGPYIRENRLGGGMTLRDQAGFQRDLTSMVGRQNFFTAADYDKMIEVNAQVGSFQMTGTKEKAEKMLENSTHNIKALYSLGVKSQDILRQMEMQFTQLGISPGEAPGRVLQKMTGMAISAQGANTTLPNLTASVVQAGQQYMNIGVGASAGAQIAAYVRSAVGDLVRQGGMTPFDIAYGGGSQESVGNTLIEGGMNIARNPLNQLMLSGMFAKDSDIMGKVMRGEKIGIHGKGGVMDMAGNAAGDPLKFKGMQVMMPRLTQHMDERLGLAQQQMFMDSMREVAPQAFNGPGGTIGAPEWLGLATNMGLTNDQAYLMMQQLTNYKQVNDGRRQSVNDRMRMQAYEGMRGRGIMQTLRYGFDQHVRAPAAIVGADLMENIAAPISEWFEETILGGPHITRVRQDGAAGSSTSLHGFVQNMMEREKIGKSVYEMNKPNMSDATVRNSAANEFVKQSALGQALESEGVASGLNQADARVQAMLRAGNMQGKYRTSVLATREYDLNKQDQIDGDTLFAQKYATSGKQIGAAFSTNENQMHEDIAKLLFKKGYGDLDSTDQKKVGLFIKSGSKHLGQGELGQYMKASDIARVRAYGSSADVAPGSLAGRKMADLQGESKDLISHMVGLNDASVSFGDRAFNFGRRTLVGMIPMAGQLINYGLDRAFDSKVADPIHALVGDNSLIGGEALKMSSFQGLLMSIAGGKNNGVSESTRQQQFIDAIKQGEGMGLNFGGRFTVDQFKNSKDVNSLANSLLEETNVGLKGLGLSDDKLRAAGLNSQNVAKGGAKNAVNMMADAGKLTKLLAQMDDSGSNIYDDRFAESMAALLPDKKFSVDGKEESTITYVKTIKDAIAGKNGTKMGLAEANSKIIGLLENAPGGLDALSMGGITKKFGALTDRLFKDPNAKLSEKDLADMVDGSGDADLEKMSKAGTLSQAFDSNDKILKLMGVRLARSASFGPQALDMSNRMGGLMAPGMSKEIMMNQLAKEATMSRQMEAIGKAFNPESIEAIKTLVEGLAKMDDPGKGIGESNSYLKIIAEWTQGKASKPAINGQAPGGAQNKNANQAGTVATTRSANRYGSQIVNDSN